MHKKDLHIPLDCIQVTQKKDLLMCSLAVAIRKRTFSKPKRTYGRPYAEQIALKKDGLEVLYLC